MESRPTVTAADIARLAGVGRAAVSNWRKRHADFPAQVAGTTASPEFDLAEVTLWLAAHGKPLPTVDSSWLHLTAGDNPLARLAEVGEFLRDGGSSDPRFAEIAALARREGSASAFAELLQRTVESPSARVRPTPDDVADLMARLAGVAGASVFDPACGTGGLLRGAVRAGCTTAYGQELDDATARVAAAWLDLHGVPGGVKVGDSLRDDGFPGLMVNAVVCAPPFGMTNWGQEELGYDPRWVYGLPPRTEPELAWVQHALAHLHLGGRAVVLMPPAAAGRRAGRRIRAELLRRGALRAVVALPARAAAPHGVALHLWMLRRPASHAQPVSEIVLADASGVPDNELLRAYGQIVADINAFEEGEPPSGDLARLVSVIELLDDEVDLNPVRRPVPRDIDHSDARLATARDELLDLVADLPRILPHVGAADIGAAVPSSTITELVRSGAVQLLGPVRSHGEKTGERTGLTVKDVVLGREAQGALEGGIEPEIEVRAGDIVVPVMARRLVARVVTTGGLLLGPGLYLLRPAEGVLDPWFVAGQLATSSNQRQTSSLSGMLRFDIRKAQVARLPYADQRRYGEAFRRFTEFDLTLQRAAALGAELVRQATDGLAYGALQPMEEEPPEEGSRSQGRSRRV
jgi:N-6 DNA methylase